MEDNPAPSFDRCLEQYRGEHLAARNLALKTRREYGADLAQATAFFIDECHLSTPASVQRQHLEGFFAHLDRRGLRGSSRRRKLAALRSFFIYLRSVDVIPSDPTQRLIPPAREHHQPRVLTTPEYQGLQLSCAHDIRDAVIIELILQTGLRLSEVAGLKVHSLDLPARISRQGTAGAVHVQGKGRKERTVTLNYKVLKALRAWLAVRPSLPGDALFTTKFRAPLGPRGIQHLVRKHLHDAGIAGASVHSLRHTFGTHMARKGTHLNVIQKAMGHESLDTTSIYIDLAREQMDKELQENAL